MVPIYEQLMEQIKSDIIQSELKEGEALPSVRTLAGELRISALTVKKAYDKLEEEGFVTTVHGKGTYVSASDKQLALEARQKAIEDDFDKVIDRALSMGMKKEDFYHFYTFRHTWATIAQNDCDANLYEVAFGMNHSHGMNVTRGYVKIDFSPAWRLNAKVIDFIFFSTKKSKQGKAKDLGAPQDKMFRISPKMMIYARAYFKGEVIAELTDIGFSNVDEVIDKLVPMLRKDIPDGCNVQFRLTNCDSQKEAVYERSKGKGF